MKVNINTKYVAMFDGQVVQEFKTLVAAMKFASESARAGFGVQIKKVDNGIVGKEII